MVVNEVIDSTNEIIYIKTDLNLAKGHNCLAQKSNTNCAAKCLALLLGPSCARRSCETTDDSKLICYVCGSWTWLERHHFGSFWFVSLVACLAFSILPPVKYHTPYAPWIPACQFRCFAYQINQLCMLILYFKKFWKVWEKCWIHLRSPVHCLPSYNTRTPIKTIKQDNMLKGKNH